MKTVTVYQGTPRIIFDNGGGITLQLPGFAHVYDDASQCADDVAEWIECEDTDDWDGNEEEAVFDPTMDEIQNGGYKVYTIDDLMTATLREINNESWGNLRSLYAALTIKILNG